MAKADNTPADDEDEDDTGAAGGAGDSDADESGAGDEGSDDDNVICTIECIPDQPGQYKLIKGDEDDSAGGSSGEDDEQGTVYKSEGLLLKAVLETVRDYEAKKSGEGNAQDNMMSGYGDEPEEPMQQKYND